MQYNQQNESPEQRQIRIGKIKLDKLHKQAQEQLQLEAGGRAGNLTILEVSNTNDSP